MKFIFLANAQDMEAVCNFDESELKIVAITMPTLIYLTDIPY